VHPPERAGAERCRRCRDGARVGSGEGVGRGTPGNDKREVKGFACGVVVRGPQRGGDDDAGVAGEDCCKRQRNWIFRVNAAVAE
jgi:hypothetical protein